jgi:hypothetical protein
MESIEALRLSLRTNESRAVSTVERYLDAAIVKIDSHFGCGYASEHPELIAAFMQSCHRFCRWHA